MIRSPSGKTGKGGRTMSKQIMVRDYPKEELPRERFIRYGPESLSNTDLLAILIRTGTKNESVLQKG